MVAEVGQQENGDRADSITGLNNRGQRTIEIEGAWRLKEQENHTWYGSRGGPAGECDRADSTTALIIGDREL
jgi:hypothetical protein